MKQSNNPINNPEYSPSAPLLSHQIETTQPGEPINYSAMRFFSPGLSSRRNSETPVPLFSTRESKFYPVVNIHSEEWVNAINRQGMEAMEKGEYVKAIKLWKQLLPVFEPGNDTHEDLYNQMKKAYALEFNFLKEKTTNNLDQTKVLKRGGATVCVLDLVAIILSGHFAANQQDLQTRIIIGSFLLLLFMIGMLSYLAGDYKEEANSIAEQDQKKILDDAINIDDSKDRNNNTALQPALS